MKATLLLFFTIVFPYVVLANAIQKLDLKYYVPKVQEIAFTMPMGKTIPFDWKVAELKPTGEGISMNWKTKIKAKNKLTLFRLTSATDVREECTLELSLGKSNEVVGVLDVKFAHYLQPFQLEISLPLLKKIAQEGLVVKMIKGTKPFWFFVPNENSDVPTVFLPHLLVSNKKPNAIAWKDRLSSLGSISTFGWMEGIVLDGLHSVGDYNMIQKHFDKYLVNDELVYEAYNNIRIKDSLTTVESILPFAFMSMRNEEHPMLKTAIDFCTDHADANGLIIDAFGGNRFLKTEECYTVSFPLALLAKKLNRPDLEHMAIVNLQTRVKMLSDANFIYQKSTEKGEKKLANWARGIGWYLLGLAKTLAILPVNNETLELRKSFLLGAEIALRHQQSNGLTFIA
jgi:unsaturated rhamnogalacturonyl hydrolase